jgi:hypothetical protein
MPVTRICLASEKENKMNKNYLEIKVNGKAVKFIKELRLLLMLCINNFEKIMFFMIVLLIYMVISRLLV